MIDIINGYEFKRNRENVIVYKISSLASVLGLPLHEVKEHYFWCVLDDCTTKGEWHTEEVVNGEIELYLPVFNLKALIDSMKREGFNVDKFQSKMLIKNMLQTQELVSDMFEVKNGFVNYSDPIRKYNLPFIKDIGESISKISSDEGDVYINAKTGELIEKE